MAILVKVGTVDTGKKVFEQGDVITGLKKEEEQELVDLGVAEFTNAAPKKGTKEEESKQEGE